MAPAPAPAAAPWSREGRPAAATAQPFAALPPYAGQPFAASPRYGDVASPLREDAAYPLRVKAERKVSGTSPGLDNPKGSAFPSLITARECQPSPAGGRRSACMRTDPPNIFSLPPGAAHSLFDVSKREWGAHPCGNSPWREPDPPPPDGAAIRPHFPAETGGPSSWPNPPGGRLPPNEKEAPSGASFLIPASPAPPSRGRRLRPTASASRRGGTGRRSPPWGRPARSCA